MPSSLKYQGCAHFRWRLISSTLSGKSLKIEKIRSDNMETPGLQDFEASFLRLIDKISDGSHLEINETGTILRYRPGILVGGKIQHDCGTNRSIGWFLEGILPLAPFCKNPLQITFTGITNDGFDLSVDVFRDVTFPLLRNFGIEGAVIQVKSRGAPPLGGGEVYVSLPVVRSLSPVNIINSGQIRRIRGTVFCSRISPTIISRVVGGAKSVLRGVISDVHIGSEHHSHSSQRGRGGTGGRREGGGGGGGAHSGGLSAGYSVCLVAESTSGALLSVERTASSGLLGGEGGPELPERVGEDAALMVLQELCLGGVVDRSHQPLILLLMALGPEDISKVRFGSELTAAAVECLRLLREAFGVVFKIKRDGGGLSGAAGQEEDEEEEHMRNEEEVVDGKKRKGPNDSMSMVKEEGKKIGRSKYCDERETVLLSCLGVGYVNMSRKIR